MSKSNSLLNYFKKVETPDGKKINAETPESKKIKAENKENDNISMVEGVRLKSNQIIYFKFSLFMYLKGTS